MAEEITMPDVKEETKPAAETAYNTSLIDARSNNTLFKLAKMYANSLLVPDTYRGNPDNCFVACEMANRMNMSPMVVMQNLYVVHGRPSWSGQFCVAAINGCGRFTPLTFVAVEDGGGGVFAKATRIADGELCISTTITMQMAKDEGWLAKNGSKWKSMPEQMLRYRAAAFFARVYCPDVLMGLQTADEVADVRGAEPSKKTTTITFGGVIDGDYKEVD